MAFRCYGTKVGQISCWNLKPRVVSQEKVLYTTIMTVTGTIQFTTQQARSIAGISSEAWRHWRKHLPHVAAKKGKAARFSMGEIVALCAVEEVVNKLGLRVAVLSDGLDQVFQACAPMSLLYLRDCSFVVTAANGKIFKTEQVRGLSNSAVVIPCENIVDQVLRATFQDSDEVYQRSLPFPPAAVARGSA